MDKYAGWCFTFVNMNNLFGMSSTQRRCADKGPLLGAIQFRIGGDHPGLKRCCGGIMRSGMAPDIPQRIELVASMLISISRFVRRDS
jgi:hypothetical protein